MCGLLLTAVFSRGEPMPVQHFEQLGPAFVDFLLDLVEAPGPVGEQTGGGDVGDVFIGLAMSYNLQFADVASNVLVARLAARASAKTWTEKVLLLLNREEDPAALVLGHRRGEQGVGAHSSVHKVRGIDLQM